MVHPDKIFGRLGNRLFQLAFCYAYSKDNNVDFYYQDPEFFEPYGRELKSMFGPKGPTIDQIAIHVRRGDYVNNPFYVDLTETSYYEDAMALFPGCDFLVFSDDIEWCKEYFKGQQFEFSEGNSEIEDLDLMSSCKGVIIANSSFSWWGAYLSNGKVVAPQKWYTDGIERTKCPKHWTRV